MASLTGYGGQDGKALFSPPGTGIRAPRRPLTKLNVDAGTSDQLIIRSQCWTLNCCGHVIGHMIGLMTLTNQKKTQKQTKCTNVEIRNKKGVEFNHKTIADG